MVIDKDKYKLGINNYFNEVTKKSIIVIGNTFNVNMRHVNGWENRLFGRYKKTATFTINLKGEIYQHFDTDYYCNFLNDELLNKKTISILLENEGYLFKNIDKKNYITYMGDIYIREDDVFFKKWKGFHNWAPYSQEQLNSISELTKILCDEHDIEKNIMTHNTKINNIYDFKGVCYKSNLNNKYNEVNPCWFFEGFSKKVTYGI